MKLFRACCTLFITCCIVSCIGLGDDQPSFKDFCSSEPVAGIVASQSNANLSESNGNVTIKAFGGSGPYTYSIKDSVFQSSPVFLGLRTDDYTVIIKDDIGCFGNVPVRIIESFDNPPSFQLTIMPIIATNCSTVGCHVTGGNAPFVFASHSQIKALSQEIKDRTQALTMPPSGSMQLTEEAIRLIAVWVDAGAPNN
jgi:hypothetical protein